MTLDKFGTFGHPKKHDPRIEALIVEDKNFLTFLNNATAKPKSRDFWVTRLNFLPIIIFMQHEYGHWTMRLKKRSDHT